MLAAASNKGSAKGAMDSLYLRGIEDASTIKNRGLIRKHHFGSR